MSTSKNALFRDSFVGSVLTKLQEQILDSQRLAPKSEIQEGIEQILRCVLYTAVLRVCLHTRTGRCRRLTLTKKSLFLEAPWQ